MTELPLLIRLADDDDDFILSLLPRFTAFTLPPWRRRDECIAGIRRDLARHLDDPPGNSHLYVAEGAHGEKLGFMRLQRTEDFFSGRRNAHIADLAVDPRHEGRGVARALLAHAEQWAREQRCQLLTLAVFPGNERARALYESTGYGIDLLRMAKRVG